MKLKSIFMAAAMAALLGACGAGGAKFSGLEKNTKDKAQVYIYRPSTLMQSGNYPDIALDTQEIGQLKTGGYLRFSASTGEHTLKLTSPSFMLWIHKDRNIPVQLEAGKTYFYKLDITGQYSYTIYAVPDSREALKDLAKLKESI